MSPAPSVCLFTFSKNNSHLSDGNPEYCWAIASKEPLNKTWWLKFHSESLKWFSNRVTVIPLGKSLLPKYCLNRFKTVLDTLPLELTDILPHGNTILNNPPLYGFTLIDEQHIPQCYTSNKNKADVTLINKNRVEVRTKVFLGTKARINCVSKNANNRLLWHGSLYWISK